MRRDCLFEQRFAVGRVQLAVEVRSTEGFALGGLRPDSLCATQQKHPRGGALVRRRSAAVKPSRNERHV